MKNTPYSLTKFTGEFLGDVKKGMTTRPVITSSTDSVKSEFKASCWSKYREALNDLMYLKRYHSIDAVLEELKRDLGG